MSDTSNEKSLEGETIRQFLNRIKRDFSEKAKGEVILTLPGGYTAPDDMLITDFYSVWENAIYH